ncbi:oligosaccharide translocation protein RFT1, variant [Diplogelasinospora grovesii]|uniref:Man(5)GlcNAc(2)-PP-dolichol translocation protein RFT1 n=1 Tax=Diplogelasinospora grovesii TaxID=303347 RepID=A0AAN6NGT8_9PEZI|nr:oligosaccharide translocation protein RFT1, variant [Diplogelasinospora grovesii]
MSSSKPDQSSHDAPASSTVAEGSTRAVRGASLLILLQIASRAVTFIANQLLLRFLTAQLLGVSTQLEVYYLSVLFFARESLRVAVQRTDLPTDSGSGSQRSSVRTQAVVNLGYLSIVLGIPLSFLFGWLYLSSLSAATLASTPCLIPSLYIYGAASILELLSEPAFVVMQTRLQFGTRAAAESIATFLRCTVTLGSAILAAKRGLDVGVLPFALGQVSYGIGLLLVYTWYGSGFAAREGFSLLPSRLTTQNSLFVLLRAVNLDAVEQKQGQKKEHGFALSYFYRPTLQLAGSMMAQSLVKHVLTQGDTFLVSILSTPTAQGVYALANNYGGLVARLIFQPVEESSRSYFSRLLATLTTATTTDKIDKTRNDQKEKDKEGKEKAVKASRDLTSLLKAYTLFSLLIITIGPTAAPLLLSLVAGPTWSGSGAGECLAAYMFYIPLLAINGVTEAFVASVETESEVNAQSVWMGVFSIGFAVAGFISLRVLDLGAVGLVLANSINMLCRILWCGVFITRYFKRQSTSFNISEMLPHPLAIAAAVVTYGAVGRLTIATAIATPVGFQDTVVQLVKIAGGGLPLVCIVMFLERRFLMDGYRALRGRR